MAAKSNESVDFGRLLIFGLIAGAVYYFFFGGGKINPFPGPAPTPIISNDFVEPPAYIKNLLPEVQSKINGRPALDLAYLYKNIAGEVRHNSKVTTLSQVVNKHNEIGKSVERNSSKDFKTGLADDFNKFMLSDAVAGKVQNNLSQEDKEKIAVGFEAIAWALFQSAGEEGLRDFHSAFYDCDENGCPKDEQKYLDYIKSISNSASFEENVDQNGKLLLMQATNEDANQVRGPPIDPTLTQGLIVNPTAIAEFNKTIPRFQQFGYDGSGEGKTVLLYESLLKYDPEAFTERQLTGDCTSHGTRNAVDIARAYEIDKLGEQESFVARGATEAIYGYRGHAGQGMSVDRAMKYINSVGGIALRKNYTDLGIDFSRYDPKEAMQWGRSGGTPDRLNQAIKPYQAQNIALINSAEEARDAISNGFAIVSGSLHEFPSKRDQYGIAKRNGRAWAHCIAWGAVSTLSDLTDGKVNSQEPYFLYINSWGPNWIAGPKGKYSSIPDGSFWISKDDAEFIIRQQQTYAVGQCVGYPAEKRTTFGFEWLD